MWINVFNILHLISSFTAKKPFKLSPEIFIFPFNFQLPFLQDFLESISEIPFPLRVGQLKIFSIPLFSSIFKIGAYLFHIVMIFAICLAIKNLINFKIVEELYFYDHTPIF